MKIWRYRRRGAIALALVTMTPTQGGAQGTDWSSVTGHVVVVESSYIPATVAFTIDQPAGTCAAGTYLVWNAAGSDSTRLSAQAQAILSVLITAKVTGQPITIWGDNTGCVVHYVHLGSS